MISLTTKLSDLIIMSIPFLPSVKFRPPISSSQPMTVEPGILRKSMEFPKKSTSTLPEETSSSQDSKKESNSIKKAGTLSSLNPSLIIWPTDSSKPKFAKSSSLSVVSVVLPSTLPINLLSTSSMTLTRAKSKCWNTPLKSMKKILNPWVFSVLIFYKLSHSRPTQW